MNDGSLWKRKIELESKRERNKKKERPQSQHNHFSADFIASLNQVFNLHESHKLFVSKSIIINTKKKVSCVLFTNIFTHTHKHTVIGQAINQSTVYNAYKIKIKRIAIVQYKIFR